MNKSEIFKKAHQAAKGFIGHYAARFALALKSIYQSLKAKKMTNSQIFKAAHPKPLPEHVYKAGKACEKNQWFWHKIDGYCKECCPPDFKETDQEIEARRSAKGYR